LLENCRRLNVALTRAKSKLIIIGSMKFLSEMTTWKGKLSTLLENRTYPITKPLIDHILNEFKDIEEVKDKEIDSDDEFS
jgi:superfamily I DNA and/or RNA helicase